MKNSFRIIDFNESIKLYKDNVGGWLGEVRKDVATLSQKQKLETARKHFMNALRFRAPRLQSQVMSYSMFFRIVYTIQTSLAWQTILLILSYLFMYIILLTAKKPQLLQQIIEFTILFIFWFDIGMEVYHKRYEILRTKSKFQSRFYIKLGLLGFLLFDEILAVKRQDHDMFLRPFLVLRCFLPTFYDKSLRKNIQAMMALYKDIIVFTFFYGGVILIFTVIVQRLVVVSDYKNYDQFKQNYVQFPRALFLMYTLSSFQSYPDNQLKAIQTNNALYLFFIIFLILNLFLFITIPTSLLFNQFKQIRSKIILVDQIKQQNSLVLAFTCLCQEDFQIPIDKFIRFLLLCFRNKLGYVQEITKITLEVDQNKNKRIQIAQFMQIIKIMYSHPSLFPPIFDDWQPWINFRRYINTKYGIKNILQSKKSKIIGSIIILFAVINCIFNIYLKYRIFEIIDDIIAIAFILELVLKMVGLGPENYFKDPWNKLDFFLILGILTTELLPSLSKSAHIDVLLKLTRSYRIALLPQYLFDKSKYLQIDHFWVRVSRLVSQILITIPLVLQFFPMYAITFYFFGVLGLQIFNNQPTKTPQQSPYSTYNQISNFDSFLYTQFYMVQVMIQAGWSIIGFDHAYRYNVPIAVSLFFFVVSHFATTLVVSALVKGVTWEVYQTIQREFQNKILKQLVEIKQDQRFKQRKQQLQNVKNQMNLNQPMQLYNLIQRQIFQGKVDFQIINKMKSASQNPKNEYMVRKSTKKTKQLLVPILVKQLNSNTSLDHLDMILLNKKSSDQIQFNPSLQGNTQKLLGSPEKQTSFQFLDEAQNNAEIDQEIERLANEAAIDGKNAYLQTITYPPQLIQLLNQKLITVQDYEIQRSNQKYQKQLCESQQSPLLNTKYKKVQEKIRDPSLFLLDSLHSLLNIQGSQRERKIRVISGFIDKNIIPEAEGKKLVYKKKDKSRVRISPSSILRDTFLRETSQKLVQKFELEYFSKICGPDFKEINQNTIQPMIRLESKLIYSLRNALRYRQIDELHFFTMLSKIQDEISSKLLKKGSLFKFVYQIDSVNQSWFTTEVVEKSRIKIHFIKNGVWIWHKKMQENQMYVGQDFFYLKELQQQSYIRQKKDQSQNRHYYLEKCAKLIYQAFETLAFGLPNHSNFFVENPSAQLYNLYCFWRNVELVKRKQERFCISKIMPVILSHEGPRMYNNKQDCLKYELTDLNIQVQKTQKIKIKSGDIFQLEDSYKQILNHVNKLQTKDEEEIQQSEGLPHSFIVNLMDQISDVLANYQENFVFRLENLINKNILVQPIMSSIQLGFISNRQSININRKPEQSQQENIHHHLDYSSLIEQKPEVAQLQYSNLFSDSEDHKIRRRVMNLQSLAKTQSYHSQNSDKEAMPTKDPI